MASASCSATTAASGAGFTMTALPMASAGATFCSIRFTGALNGVMAATTP
jgi:hypothetical protein